MCEDSGAKLITIHGRVKTAVYSGEVNYNEIYKAKCAVKIPVIANGGVFCKQDADKLMQNTGADGVMLARGAIADPFLTAKLTKTTSDFNLKNYILKHAKLMKWRYSEHTANVEFRKFVPYYFKGMQGVKELKQSLVTAESIDKLIQLIEQNL